MSVEGLISHLSCVDGDKILTVGSPLKISSLTEESVDTCRINLVDSESGETIRRLCDVSYYDYLQSDIMQAPGENMSVNVWAAISTRYTILRETVLRCLLPLHSA